MAASSRECTIVLLAGLAVAGCTAGNGEGEASGIVNAPRCGLEGEPFDLSPSFFVADPTDDERVLEIRIQRDSNFEDKADGLAVLVLDANRVKEELLGLPIDFADGDDALVRMSLYLNERCPVLRDEVPVSYTAVEGTITFVQIYAPDIDDGDKTIAATFDDVLFTDLRDPETRNATMSGAFRFIFNRGRPAQRFP